MKCSHIPYHIASTLLDSEVTLRELGTGVTFQATIEDICCEDQKGIIVKFDKSICDLLHNKKTYEIDFQEDKVGMDLRNIHEGQYFEILSLSYH